MSEFKFYVLYFQVRDNLPPLLYFLFEMGKGACKDYLTLADNLTGELVEFVINRASFLKKPSRALPGKFSEEMSDFLLQSIIAKSKTL